MPVRDELYVIGLPAVEPSSHLVEFAATEAGHSIVDIGCGYGAYALKLRERGHRVAGLELDPAAVARAREHGLDVVHGDASATPFEDDAFDTALLFEVLEHVPDPGSVLREALRVSSRNVLVTVPNVGEYVRLAPYALTYWHLVTEDHVNFFTKADLERLGDESGADAAVRLAEPLEACGLVPERRFWWYVLAVAQRLRLLRPVAYGRLYAVFTKRAP